MYVRQYKEAIKPILRWNIFLEFNKHETGLGYSTLSSTWFGQEAIRSGKYFYKFF